MEKEKKLSAIIEKFGKDMPNQISLALREILEIELKDVNFAREADIKPLDTIIHSYMQKIDPELKNISKRIAEIIDTKIDKEYKSEGKSH